MRRKTLFSILPALVLILLLLASCAAVESPAETAPPESDGSDTSFAAEEPPPDDGPLPATVRIDGKYYVKGKALEDQEMEDNQILGYITGGGSNYDLPEQDGEGNFKLLVDIPYAACPTDVARDSILIRYNGCWTVFGLQSFA